MAIDFLVVGAGMAGAAAGYYLADHGRVVLLESEPVPGYHSTGRSAALYTETYGNAAVRALTVGSGPFFRSPPAGFAEVPLLRPRGVMLVATPADKAIFDEAVAAGRRFAPSLRVLDLGEAMSLCRVLREDWLGHAFLEPDAMDLDVHAIHQGFLGGIRAKGGSIVASAPAQAIARHSGQWQVTTPAGHYSAPALVNAGGAWADEVAGMAGVPPIGLIAKRRTAFIVAAPEGPPIDAWPMVIDVAQTFYFKPESGRLLISPADETPMPAQDVQPDDIDIAVAAERIAAATRIAFRTVQRKWAGLRTFAPDGTLVIGPDPAAPSFVWMAGQGGYGIQTAPAAGAAAAALAVGSGLPAGLAALGLRAEQLLPDRLRGSVS